MANEAVLLVQESLPINFTVANGTGIEKGAFLSIADPMTAALNTTRNGVCCGIAANEKIANDGVTKIGVFQRGIFKVKCSGSINVGAPIMAGTSGSSVFENYVEAAPGLAATSVSGSALLGYALETGANGETIRAAIRL